ncbi:MAG TPA: hypothetical protein VFT67_17570 [Jatrophihabitantaceae bacterium]|nr:hypothetical protein [Jatrophihabitantaceae bacterium]
MSDELCFDDAAKDVLRRAISRVERLLRRLELPGPPIVVPALGEIRPEQPSIPAPSAPRQAPAARKLVSPGRDLAAMRSEIESLRADAIADASLLLVDAQVIAASVLTQACGLAERTLDGADTSRMRADELLTGAGAAAEDARDAVDELVAELVAVRERLTGRVDELNERINALAAVAGADR